MGRIGGSIGHFARCGDIHPYGFGGCLYGSRTFTSVAGQTLVRAGESWVGYSSAGGGWGRPCDRNAETVRENLRDGIISEETARNLFGVVLNDDLERTINIAETENLRDQLRQEKTSLIDPVKPAAGSWLEENMGAKDRYIEAPTIAEHFQDNQGE